MPLYKMYDLQNVDWEIFAAQKFFANQYQRQN